jgi:hypothetical protein
MCQRLFCQSVQQNVLRLIALEGGEAGLSTWNSGIKFTGTDRHIQTPHQTQI